MAFDHSSFRRFEAYSCKSASGGLPSSLVQLRAITGRKITTHLFALVAHFAVSISVFHRGRIYGDIFNMPSSAAQIACRMFSRWTQENFFKYMRQEYNLDHLITYDVEAADGDRLAPCPVYKEQIKQITRMKAELEILEKDYGQRALKNKDSEHPSMCGFNIANAGYKRKIRLLQQQIEKAKAELKTVPKKVALKTLAEHHEMVRLEKDRNYLSDVVKMSCYRAETSLLNLLSPYFVRAVDEGRAFLKALFKLPADIVPDEQAKILTIKFHAMANPRSNRALKELCEIMNAEKCHFPQTPLQMLFKAPSVASETAPCQEL